MISSQKIKDNLTSIYNKIGSESKIEITHVTKNRSPDEINLLLVAFRELKVVDESCLPIIGENYVQEYAQKKAKILYPHTPHLIGKLQESNVKQAVALFDVIQSCHSEKILKAIQKQATAQKKRQKVLLQVNISDDPNKGGFVANELIEMLEGWKEQSFTNLLPLGIMTITKFYENRSDVKADFVKMKALQQKIEQVQALKELFYNQSVQLSMGMSVDYDIAVQAGATVVRIGSAIFEE